MDRDPKRPTATAPESVHESVYEEAEHAGSSGPDAADPPLAAQKAEGESPSPTDPGSDLEPEEGADLLETRREARRIKQARDDMREDEDLISLDTPD